MQIDNMLKMDSESLSTKYCVGEHFKTDAVLSPDVYHLIHTLLLHIHQSEPDTERSILVFLPTYHALEEQWARLSGCSTLKVHILHRSIDTDEALETMKASESCRKVQVVTYQFNLVQLHLFYMEYLFLLSSHMCGVSSVMHLPLCNIGVGYVFLEYLYGTEFDDWNLDTMWNSNLCIPMFFKPSTMHRWYVECTTNRKPRPSLRYNITIIIC